MDEQDELYRHVCRSSSSSSPESVWHAKSGGFLGFLVDIGAVRPLIGSALVRSQVAGMEKQGFKATWQYLLHPGSMGGIGRGSQQCSKFVHLIGALHDGKFIAYSSLVLGEGPSHPETAATPPLYGLNQFSGMNSLSDSRSRKFVCVREGKSVDWLAGVRALQCEQASSGHWLLGVGHWGKVPRSEVERVQRIRSESSALWRGGLLGSQGKHQQSHAKHQPRLGRNDQSSALLHVRLVVFAVVRGLCPQGRV